MTPWFLLLLRAGRVTECAVQREVQVEHAHARFAEHAELARQGDPVDEHRNLRGIDAARLRDPRLERSPCADGCARRVGFLVGPVRRQTVLGVLVHLAGADLDLDCATVVGFDDSAIARTIWPELTTIHQPIAEMSRMGVELLAGMLRGEWAYALGWLIQAVAIGLGFVIPMMFALGAIFAMLWGTAYFLGRKIERDRAAAYANGHQT